MMRVLVTGATGFIGRHALEPLARRGFEVHAVRHSAPPAAEGVRWHRADLLDRCALGSLMRAVRPSHLLHLAWYAVPRDYRTSPENLRWRRAGMELLEEFACAGGRRAVLAGTCFEYDLGRGLCAEDATPLAPATVYAACKNALSEAALQFARRAGLSLAWARIFYLYGPHEPPTRLVPSVILSLMRGERARCTHGLQVRDFLHVEDVASALAALLASPVEGAVNIGSGEPVTIRDMVGRIADQMGAGDRVDFGAIEPAATDAPVVFAATARLRDEVGFRPRWPLADGLASTIRWWQQHPEARDA